MFNVRKRIDKILKSKYPDWKIIREDQFYYYILERDGMASYYISSADRFATIILPTRKYFWLLLGLDFKNSRINYLDHYVESAIRNSVGKWI